MKIGIQKAFNLKIVINAAIVISVMGIIYYFCLCHIFIYYKVKGRSYD